MSREFHVGGKFKDDTVTGLDTYSITPVTLWQ